MDNNKKDGQVLPFAKPAAAANEIQAGAQPLPMQPAPKTFLFTLLPDEEGREEVVAYTGYISCTSSFIGVFDTEGELVAVFPLDTIKYMRKAEDQAVAA